jgi:hypothetical protein
MQLGLSQQESKRGASTEFGLSAVGMWAHYLFVF